MAVTESALGATAAKQGGSVTEHETAGAGIITVAAGDTFLLLILSCETASPGTVTAHWNDPTGNGSGQLMSLVGTVETITGSTSTFMGVVNPTSGHNCFSWSFSGQVGQTGAYIAAISFKGSDTSSVANATFAFNKASGTGTTASVASAVAIPVECIAVSSFIDAGAGFSNANPDSAGTLIGENQSNAVNGGSDYYSGAGSTITASAALAGTDPWSAIIVGVQPPQATSRPYNPWPQLGPVLAQ
jgi:hypothetical protein